MAVRMMYMYTNIYIFAHKCTDINIFAYIRYVDSLTTELQGKHDRDDLVTELLKSIEQRELILSSRSSWAVTMSPSHVRVTVVTLFQFHLLNFGCW